MNNIKKLFRILDRWKYNYVFAALLLTVSVLLRLTEPKILQLAIDKILVFFNSGGKDMIKTNDFISSFILSLLPEMKIENILIDPFNQDNTVYNNSINIIQYTI